MLKLSKQLVVGSSGGDVVHVRQEVMCAGVVPNGGKCPRRKAPRAVDKEAALALYLQWITTIGKSFVRRVATGFQTSSGMQT